jgi:hypothetical protein
MMRLLHSFILLALTVTPATALQQQPASRQDNQQNNQPKPPADQKPKPPQAPPKTETFWQKVLRVAGISATPSAMKGNEGALAGDLWIFDLNTNVGRSITRDGGYRSPIFLAGEKKLLAIKGEDLVEVAIDGVETKKLHAIKGIVKLVGVNADDRDQVLVLSKDERQRPSVELLSLKDGRRSTLKFNVDSEEDGKMLEHLRGWERVYDGGRIVIYTKTETNEGLAGSKIEWSDVYLKKGNQEPVNVSNCDGANCGQPSLSSNALYVVYIKEAN